MLTGGIVSAAGNLSVGNVYTGGTVSATGTITSDATVTGGNIATAGTVSAVGNITGGNINTAGLASVTGNVQAGNVLTTGVVSATGDITGGNVVTAGLVSATGNIQGGNLATDGVVSAVGTATVGNVATAGTVTATGNITGGNLNTTGQIVSTASGNSADGGGQIYLNGATNNRIDWNTNGTGAPAYTTRSVGAKVVLYPNLGVSSTDYALGVEAGALWSGIPGNDAGQFFKWYGGNVPVASLSGTGVFSATGNVTGDYFIGNGSQLTGVIAANMDANLLTGNTLSANVVNSSLTSVGNLAALSVVGTATAGNLNTAGTITATGNVIGGNINTAGLISATGNVTTGNVLTGGLISAAGNVTGNYFLGNIACATGYNSNSIFNGTSNVLIATADGNITMSVAGVPDVVVVTSSGLQTNNISTTGNATIGGDLVVNGDLTYVNVADLNVEDPIIGLGRGPNNTPLTTNDNKDRGEQLWYYDSSEKSAFTGYDNSAGKILLATDVTIANEIVTVNNYGNIVIGNLEGASTSVTGNATAGNLLTGGAVSATGTVTGGNVATGGIVSATGNIISGANIIAMSGTVVTDNIKNQGGTGIYLAPGPSGYINFFTSAGDRATVTDAGNISAVGTIIGANVLTSGVVSAGGDVTGANILTSGLISAAGNITGNYIFGNIAAGGTNTQVQFNDDGILNATTALTFNKSTNTLAVLGNVNTGNASVTGNIIVGNSIQLANNNGGTTQVFRIEYNAANSAVDFIFV